MRYPIYLTLGKVRYRKIPYLRDCSLKSNVMLICNWKLVADGLFYSTMVFG